MNEILQGVPIVICYIDDILATGIDECEHLANLMEVLLLLHKYGVRVQQGKCAFLRNSVKYLGYQIELTGLHACNQVLNQGCPGSPNTQQCS